MYPILEKVLFRITSNGCKELKMSQGTWCISTPIFPQELQIYHHLLTEFKTNKLIKNIIFVMGAVN